MGLFAESPRRLTLPIWTDNMRVRELGFRLARVSDQQLFRSRRRLRSESEVWLGSKVGILGQQPLGDRRSRSRRAGSIFESFRVLLVLLPQERMFLGRLGIHFLSESLHPLAQQLTELDESLSHVWSGRSGANLPPSLLVVAVKV